LISEIDILPKLYGRVLVPPSVADELRHPRAPEAVRSWIAAPPAWLEVRATSLAPDEELFQADLEIVERDAILLAQELLTKALDALPEPEAANAVPPERRTGRSLIDAFAEIRGLLNDEEIDRMFSRNPSTARPVDLS
jgi:hypothetical protein